MDIVVKVDGAEIKTTVYKHSDGSWWNTIYQWPGKGTVSVDLSRYETNRWIAQLDRGSRRICPELANLVSEGKTMAEALVPFYGPVVAAKRRAYAQEVFKQEQLEVLREIAACFEPDEARALFQRVQAELVLPWEWSGVHGGQLKDGARRQIATVRVPVDGVVIWSVKHFKGTGESSYSSHGGFVHFVNSDDWKKDEQQAAVDEARELAEAWLREQGVL